MKYITWNRCLNYPSNKEIDIIYITVDHLQSLHYFRRNDISQEVEAIHSTEAAEFPEGVISRQSMISPSLYIQSHQVHPEALILGLEEMIGHLL